MMAGSQRIKQGKASLIGGIAVGIAAGVLVAAGIATWIRKADL
jgi:hypothetical protein